MDIPKPTFSHISDIEDEILVRNQLADPVRKFVEDSFGILNEVQRAAIPRISSHHSTLIMSPTGSGKTLAGFLGILSELYRLEMEGKLEPQIYVLYISPLKALNNDIHKNLEEPLEFIKNVSGTVIRSAKRTGDTTTSERAKLLKNPPHILITTPESFGLMLTAPKFKENLKQVKWVIVDEIHSIAENKRGTMLSLCLERLEYTLEKPLTRIGLSATIEPPELIANFLVGNREIDVDILDFGKLRELEIEVLSPVPNLVHAPYSIIHKSHLEMIHENVQNNRTTLIFTNTRNLSEKLVYDLDAVTKGEYGSTIAVHHGSLDYKMRMDVENRLKQGKMRAVFSSTSLEMGIDIGSIDLTIQVGSPKTVRALLQRIGRSGHSQNLTSKGKILVFSRDDLIECTALAKLALQGKVDAIRIPQAPTDVLFQMITGMALEQKWTASEAYSVISKSFVYRELTFSRFIELLENISNPTSDEDGWKYGYIWYDPETHEFGKRRRARQAYMQNIGTIPATTSIEVVLQGYRTRIGQVTERFSEFLKEGDVFVLGAKMYEFVRAVGKRIIVQESFGVVPTIPSWTGERQPRTWELCQEISFMYSQIDTLLKTKNENAAKDWLLNEYPIGVNEASAIVNYALEQQGIAQIPNFSKILIEKYVDPSGSTNILILGIFGAEVNAIISQAIGAVVSHDLGSNIAIISTDNGFLLRIPPGIDLADLNIFNLITPETLEDRFIHSVKQTELFKMRFRYSAGRALMILRMMGQRKIGMDQQQKTSRWLLKTLDPKFPIIQEALREIMHDKYDIDRAQYILQEIKNHIVSVEILPQSDIPSPMTHEILLNGNLDIVFTEDRTSFLQTLHRQVLSRLLPEVGDQRNLLSGYEVDKFFQAKLFRDTPELTVKSYTHLPRSPDNYIENAIQHLGFSEKQLTGILVDHDDILKLSDGSHISIESLPFYAATRSMEFWKTINLEEPRLLTCHQQSQDISPDQGLEYLVRELLFYNGPSTISYISSNLKFSEDRIQQIIWKLQRSNSVLAGSFTTKEKEYMLREDRDSLVHSAREKRSTEISEDLLREFRLYKSRLRSDLQSSRINIDDFLRENGPVRDPIEFVSRLPSFNWTDLRKLIIVRDVYFGRFLGRRLVFMHSSDIESFIIVARSNQKITDLAQEILILINDVPGLTLRQIRSQFTLKHNEIQQALNYLETELYISRIGWELTLTHGGFPHPQYIPLPSVLITEETYEKAVRNILKLCCKWYGFLTLEDFLRISRLPYPTIELGLEELDQELITKTIFGYIYYGLKEHVTILEQIDIQQSNSEVYLLGPYDPYFYTHVGSLRRNHIPRQTQLTILRAGKPQGYIEIMLPDKDVLQVLNLQIAKRKFQDFKLIQQIGTKLIELARKAYQVHAVYIEDIQFKAANHLDNRIVVSTLKDVGYRLLIDHLVTGTKHQMEISKQDVYETRQIQMDKSSNTKYEEIKDLFRENPIISSSNSLEQLTGDHTKKQLQISQALRLGSIHHYHGMFYSNDLWNSMITGNVKLPQKIIDNLRSPISISSLSEKTNLTKLKLREYLDSAVKERVVELISPFSPVPEFRLTQTSARSRSFLSNWILSIIRIYGPLPFSDILAHVKELTNISRVELLYTISTLLDKIKVESLSLRETSQRKDRLVYYTPLQKTILLDPTRKTQIKRWNIIEKSVGIFDGFDHQDTHGMVFQGRLVAKIQLRRENDGIVIEDFTFLDENFQDFTSDHLPEMIQELEKYIFQKGLRNIRILKLQNAFPNYWMKLQRTSIK